MQIYWVNKNGAKTGCQHNHSGAIAISAKARKPIAVYIICTFSNEGALMDNPQNADRHNIKHKFHTVVYK